MYTKKKSWHTAPLTFLAELLTMCMCHIVHHTQHAAIRIICVIYGVVCVLSVLENLDVEALKPWIRARADPTKTTLSSSSNKIAIDEPQ